MIEWYKYNDQAPVSGAKVIVVADDGCSSSVGYMTDGGLLDGECGCELTPSFLNGAIWAFLPDEYAISFMEVTPEDWR